MDWTLGIIVAAIAMAILWPIWRTISALEKLEREVNGGQSGSESRCHSP